MEDLDHLWQKEFEELTPSEKKSLEGLCDSEETFNHLKKIMVHVENYSKINLDINEPSDRVKNKLDDLFEQVYKEKKERKPLIRLLYPREKKIIQRPIVQIAALFIVFILTIPILRDRAEGNTTIAHHKSMEKKTINQESESNSDSIDQLIEDAVGKKGNNNAFIAKNDLKQNLVSEENQSDFRVQKIKSEEIAEEKFSFIGKSSVNEFTYKTQDEFIFSVKDNMALLELLTPAF
jgi:hypothetical protein